MEPWLSATTDQESILWVATSFGGYGTYIAARINAELGTEYDIQKFTTWSFDRGHLEGGDNCRKMGWDGRFRFSRWSQWQWQWLCLSTQWCSTSGSISSYGSIWQALWRMLSESGCSILPMQHVYFIREFLPAHLQDGTAWFWHQRSLRESWPRSTPGEMEWSITVLHRRCRVKGRLGSDQSKFIQYLKYWLLRSHCQKTNVDKILRLNLNENRLLPGKILSYLSVLQSLWSGKESCHWSWFITLKYLRVFVWGHTI